MQPLISIIIPVYNVSQYLEYCMESVIQQEYKNLEIILIDDGSTDQSGKMCDEYAEMDSRIRVIHKANGGLSDARNVGMSVMNGEYYTFIDSDDYVRVDYISQMYKYILEDNTDVVICSFKKVIGNDDIFVKENGEQKPKHFKFNQSTIKSKMLAREVPMYAPGKLYRAEFAANMEFPKGRLYEDVPTTWNVIKRVKCVTYFTEKLYFYRQRIDSIVNMKFRHERMDQLFFSEEILKELDETDTLYYTAEARCFFAAADNLTFVSDEFPKDKEYLIDAIEKYRKGTIKDPLGKANLKVMAYLSYISPEFVRIMGKLYKRFNYIKWKRKESSYKLKSSFGIF